LQNGHGSDLESNPEPRDGHQQVFSQAGEKTAPPVKAPAPVEPAKGSSKTDEIIVLLSSAAVATLPQLMAATGWQKHSARGFLSGTLNKKLGLKLSCSKNEVGERLYGVC